VLTLEIGMFELMEPGRPSALLQNGQYERIESQPINLHFQRGSSDPDGEPRATSAVESCDRPRGSRRPPE
jgi:hypothetical protein